MNSGDSNPTHGDLEGLIARHFDGHLDVNGERQLADLLAASAEARQTFASYLRLEGAAIKLAKARELGAAAESAPELPAMGLQPELVPAAEVQPAVVVSNTRVQRVSPAWLAVAASLLAAVVLGQWLWRANRTDQVQQVAHVSPLGDMDQLADMWLQVRESSPSDESAAIDTASTLEAGITEDSITENSPEVGVEAVALIEADPPAEVTTPPDWMLVAMADLAAGSDAEK